MLMKRHLFTHIDRGTRRDRIEEEKQTLNANGWNWIEVGNVLITQKSHGTTLAV